MSASGSAPIVSVVMPVFNEARFVQAAIDSILRQTLRDLELVIVDNGSTDSTPQVLDRIRDPRVRVFRNPRNLGSAAAGNRAVRESRAPLIARMDADDVAVAHRLERQLAAFAAQPRLMLLGAQARHFGAGGRTLLRSIAPIPVTRTGIRWHSLFSSPYVHSTVMFTRESFEVVGGYDERMQRSADFALFSRIQARYDAANLPDVLVEYRFVPRTALVDSAQAELVQDVIEHNAWLGLDAPSADPHLARLIAAWPDYCMMLRGTHASRPNVGRVGLFEFVSAFRARFGELYEDPAGASEIAANVKFILCRSAWDAARRGRRDAVRLAGESLRHAPFFSCAFVAKRLADGALERR